MAKFYAGSGFSDQPCHPCDACWTEIELERVSPALDGRDLSLIGPISHLAGMITASCHTKHLLSKAHLVNGDTSIKMGSSVERLTTLASALRASGCREILGYLAKTLESLPPNGERRISSFPLFV